MEPQGDLRKGLNIKTSTFCQEEPVSYSNPSTRNGQENVLLAVGVEQTSAIGQRDATRERERFKI